MKVFTTKEALKTHLNSPSLCAKQIGFVPTMGALHEGHLSLLRECKKNNSISVVSIFVNPIQFDKKDDLEKYPRTLSNDLRLLENEGCDVVFTPSVDEMYSKNSSTLQFDFDGLEDIMEGAFRSGHFNGVGTVVKLLFEMINPTRAYFGENDFQQLLIIRKMVEKHQLPVQIIGCSIFREDNGLAMSSRNERLSKSAKQEAALIYRILTVVREMTTNHSLEDIHQWVCLQFKDHPLFFLEYFIIANERTLQTATIIDPKIYYRAFIAVKVGSVRLIDNIAL